MYNANMVNEIFIEHHNCLGMSFEEIEDLIADSTLEQRAIWLKKIGYELEEMK